MNEKPLISIIVPIYNLELYLSDCVGSIIGQTYKNLEIILIDDGSSDSSGNIADTLALSDNRIIVVHKENAGVSSARNVGIDIASGEYIGFVDGDDIIEPDMYECLVTNAVRYKADISHVSHDRIYADGRVEALKLGCGIKKQNREEALGYLLNGLIDPTDCTKIYSASVAKKYRFDTEIAVNEDLLYNFRCFNDSEAFVYEDVCKYHYYIRKSSSSRRIVKEKSLQDQIDVKKIILNELNGTSLEEEAKKAYINTYVTVLKSLTINATNGDNEYRNELIKEIKQRRHYYHYLTIKRKVLLLLLLYFPKFVK